MSILSLALPGSLSVALTTTAVEQSFASAAWTTPELAREGECRAALAAQVDLLGHGDQLFDGKPGQAAEDVAVRRQVKPGHPVKARGQPGRPDPHDRGGADPFHPAQRHWSPPGTSRSLGSAESSRRDRRGARGTGPVFRSAWRPGGPYG